MRGDLGERLGRVAGRAGPAPDLNGLWERGRRHRRHRRMGTGLGAVVAVAALVAGGMALSGGGADTEGVVAGPGSSRPPAEPTDLAVRMVVEAGSPLDGIPTLEPGERVVVSYLGNDGEWMRGMSVDWEAWDGSSWEQTHTLVLGTGPDGSDGQVVPIGEDLFVPAAGMSGPGPDPFPTPSDLGPGWYRVCVEMGMPRRGGDASGEPPGVSSTVLPPSSELVAPPGSVLDPAGDGGPQRVRPCAQLRVPAG